MPSFVNIDKYRFLKSAFMPLIPEVRDSFKLGEDEHVGTRFNSDDRTWSQVLGTLGQEDREIQLHEAMEMALPEDEMKERIMKALHNSASADYYYLFEKEYD